MRMVVRHTSKPIFKYGKSRIEVTDLSGKSNDRMQKLDFCTSNTGQETKESTWNFF